MTPALNLLDGPAFNGREPGPRRRLGAPRVLGAAATRAAIGSLIVVG